MPIGGGIIPDGDMDDYDNAMAAVPVPQGERTAAAFGNMDFTRRAVQFAKDLIPNYLQIGNGEDAEGNALGPKTVDPETLNQQYGVPGYLRFNEPRTSDDAAFMSAQARERQYRDFVFSRTNPQPLTDMAASLTGSLLDPVGLGVMVGTGGLGEAAVGGFDALRGALAARAAVDTAQAAPALSTLGRVANAAGAGARYLGAGAVDNIPFTAINAGLSNLYGEDYGWGDALRDIAAGAVLHTATHLAFRGARALFGPRGDPDAPAVPGLDEAQTSDGFEPNPAPASGMPPEVEALSETARQGAFVKAVSDMVDDRPVDVAQYVDRELDARAAPADMGIPATGEATPNVDLGPADRPALDAGAAGGAGDGVERGPFAAPAPDPDQVHFDQNHADLYRLGQSLSDKSAAPDRVEAEASRLADTMGRHMDWTDVVMSKASRRTLEKTGAPPAIEMRRAAADYFRDVDVENAGGVSLYDPDRLQDAIAANRPRVDPARQLLANTADRFARGDDGQPELLRPPGETAPKTAPAPEPLTREAPGEKNQPGGSRGVEKSGPAAAAPEEKTPGEAGTGARGARFIQADPELKALADDTDRMAAGAGLELKQDPKQDPNTLAEAIRAAAVCLAEEAE